jgi:hypothetical protein
MGGKDMNRFLTRGLLAGLAVGAMGVGVAQAQNRYYDDGYNDRGHGSAVRCESRDGRTAWCRMDTRGGVRLVRQYSDRACVRGQTWGVRGDAVWVSRGCRGGFAAVAGDSRYYGYDDRNRDRGRYDDRYDNRYDNRYDDRNDDRNDRYGSSGYGRVLRCESRDGRYNFCRASGYADRAQIRRVLSDANCRLNYSWGYRNGGVWVDNGCRAEFVVY